MKGRLVDFSIGYDGKQRITLELDRGDFREGYGNLKDVPLEISIKKWRQRRSKDANAYFHVLVNEIATARGLPDDEVKRQLVVDYGTIAKDENGLVMAMKLPRTVDPEMVYPYAKMYKQTEENGIPMNCYILYKRSSWLDSKEMARLIEGTIQEAKELNIDTDTPETARWWKNLESEDCR